MAALRELLATALARAFGGLAGDLARLVAGYAMSTVEQREGDLYLRGEWAQLRDPAKVAARIGSSRLLAWAISRPMSTRDVYHFGTELVINGGSLGLIRWARAHLGVKWDGQCFADHTTRMARFDDALLIGALRVGDCAILRWVLARRPGAAGRVCSAENACLAAARCGNLVALQSALRAPGSLPLDDGESVCAHAAAGGHIAVLKWLRRKGFLWNSDVFAEAAEGGHLSLLRWLRFKGCPRDSVAGHRAARGGHLAVLEWLVANRCCLLSRHTCASAAEGGRLEVLQWLRGRGCEWDEETCAEAASRGYLDVLGWALANGCPRGAYCCQRAAGSGQLGALQLLRAHGCPWTSDVVSCAEEEGHTDVVEWATLNGCPPRSPTAASPG